MKKLILTIVTALCCATNLQAAERAINKNELPEKAKTFVTEKFSNDKIVAATEEKCYYFFTCEYNAILASGTKIEFDSDGEWRKVECIRGRRVPSAIIPDKIARYIQENFAQTQVMKIEKERRTIEVELNNKVELKFNLDGDLLEIDL